MNDFDTFTKLPNNVSDLGKIIVATGFEWLPKVQENRPIWSHWLSGSYVQTSAHVALHSLPTNLCTSKELI